jgi:hypothetical protein
LITLATQLDTVLPPSASQSERRAELRTRYDATAQLLPYPRPRHAHVIDLTVVDYSESGIGAVHSEGLLVGQMFIVREPRVTRDRTCLYQVVRSEKRSDGRYNIGLTAMKPLEDEWAPFTPPPAPGLDLWTKWLYLIFAIAGAATIVLAALRLHHRH